jgi:hypothetical protein
MAERGAQSGRWERLAVGRYEHSWPLEVRRSHADPAPPATSCSRDIDKHQKSKTEKNYWSADKTVNNDWSGNKTVKNDWSADKTVKHDWSENETVKNDWSGNETVKNDWSGNKTVRNDWSGNETVKNDWSGNKTVKNDWSGNKTVKNVWSADKTVTSDWSASKTVRNVWSWVLHSSRSGSCGLGWSCNFLVSICKPHFLLLLLLILPDNAIARTAGHIPSPPSLSSTQDYDHWSSKSSLSTEDASSRRSVMTRVYPLTTRATKADSPFRLLLAALSLDRRHSGRFHNDDNAHPLIKWHPVNAGQWPFGRNVFPLDLLGADFGSSNYPDLFLLNFKLAGNGNTAKDSVRPGHKNSPEEVEWREHTGKIQQQSLDKNGLLVFSSLRNIQGSKTTDSDGEEDEEDSSTNQPEVLVPQLDSESRRRQSDDHHALTQSTSHVPASPLFRHRRHAPVVGLPYVSIAINVQSMTV